MLLFIFVFEDRYREYSNAFEKYLSNDHEASMKVLEEADQEARNSSKMISKRDRLFKEFGQVRLEVYQWREMWRDAKMCHDFIRKVFSPPQLKAATATAVADDSVCKEDEKSDNYESESIVYEEPAAKSSLECLIGNFSAYNFFKIDWFWVLRLKNLKGQFNNQSHSRKRSAIVILAPET